MLSTEDRARKILLTTLLAVAVTVTACSSASGNPAEEPTPTTSAPLGTTTSPVVTTTTLAPTTTVPAKTANVVEVTAQDYAFVGLPSAVNAGARIRLVNESTKELHELVVFRLPDEETRRVEELAQLPISELDAFFSRVETVILAPPGRSGYAQVGTDRLDEPGRYAIFCTIPIGADPNQYLTAVAESEGRPEFEGGLLHYQAGMWAGVTVEG